MKWIESCDWEQVGREPNDQDNAVLERLLSADGRLGEGPKILAIHHNWPCLVFHPIIHSTAPS